jgi:molybdopterin-containing oxidoreductase family iron-sulfur binding subunit
MPELDRRDFLKLVGVSAGGAAAAGCSDHVEQLIPYVVQPEEIVPGNPVFYASTCTECPVGCGVHVKTREGRPIKLEGNPENPVNKGRLCAKAQASVERTYTPDRFAGPMIRGADGTLAPATWDDALQKVATAIKAAPAKTHVLGGDPGYTANGVVDQFVAAVGAGGRTIDMPFSGEALRGASERVFGVRTEPLFDLEGADLVIDFGNEVLDTGLSPVEHQRQWAHTRDPEEHPHGGARLVYVGARLSLTASSSDEWLPAKPGSEGILALALARAAVEAGANAHPELLGGILSGADAASAAAASDIPAETIQRIGAALAKAQRPVALPPGVAVLSRRAIGTSAAVLVLNAVIGAVGSTVIVPEPVDDARSRASYRDALALTKAMQNGKVGVLLVHDSNPAYAMPSSTGFVEALDKVGMVVSLSSAVDETTALADVVLPVNAPLESWGDARPRSGVRALIQPTFRPLHDTRSLPDALLDLARAAGATSGVPAGDFKSILEAAWADTDFRAALLAGGVYGPVVAAEAGFDSSRVEVADPVFTGPGEMTLLTFPHSFLREGSGASLSTLQEVPDPVTSVAWDSWAEISLDAAEELGVDSGDVIEIATSAGSIEVAVYPRGGIRDDVVAVPLGQGHTVGWFASKEGQGMPGMARGVNAADVLPGDGVDEDGGRAFLTEKATLRKTGRHRRLPMLQFNDNQRGRGLGQAMAAAAVSGDNGHGGGHGPAQAEGHGGEHGGGHGDGHGAAHEILEPYDPADDANDAQYERTFDKKGEAVAKESPYRWGMAIDLDRCTGCSACIAACYIENNIPRVGEEETRNVRQMAWLRIDRWVGDGEVEYTAGRQLTFANHEKLGDTDIRNQPLLCQQCGAAPCEPVCPVIATYHNEEGLNAMIYNRCIGTRYCANNCPYKVRRYNYFDNQLTKWPAPMELGLNPDVTVRGQGVMEKCNFCVQRIQSARQTVQNEGQGILLDGDVQTACQQTCPSEAITFGNLRDENSAASKRSDSKRGYHALHVLNTRPAITYLAKVTRGPVEG